MQTDSSGFPEELFVRLLALLERFETTDKPLQEKPRRQQTQDFKDGHATMSCLLVQGGAGQRKLNHIV